MSIVRLLVYAVVYDLHIYLLLSWPDALELDRRLHGTWSVWKVGNRMNRNLRSEDSASHFREPTQREIQRLRDSYVKSLLSGDEEAASQAVIDAVSHEWRPSTIYIEVLAKAMVEIGERWHDGQISIAHEHQATQVTLRQVNLLRQFFPPVRSTGLHALVSAIDRDGHLLGSMIFSDLLYFDGWNTDFLGAGTPPDDLALLATERQPDLVALSATQSNALDLLASTIAAIRHASANTFIVIGGLAVSSDPRRASALGADLVSSDPVKAVVDVGKHFDIAGAGVPLDEVLQRVGHQIRSKRTSMGLSQKELADLSDLDRSYLSGVEQGKQNITMGALKKIGDALNIQISDMVS